MPESHAMAPSGASRVREHEHDVEGFCLHPVSGTRSVCIEKASNDTIWGCTETETNKNLAKYVRDVDYEAAYAGEQSWYMRHRIRPPGSVTFTGIKVCSKQPVEYFYQSELIALVDKENGTVGELEKALGEEAEIKAIAKFRRWEECDSNALNNTQSVNEKAEVIGEIYNRFPSSATVMWADVVDPECKRRHADVLTSLNLASWSLELDPEWLNTLKLNDELRQRARELQMSGTGRVNCIPSTRSELVDESEGSEGDESESESVGGSEGEGVDGEVEMRDAASDKESDVEMGE